MINKFLKFSCRMMLPNQAAAYTPIFAREPLTGVTSSIRYGPYYASKTVHGGERYVKIRHQDLGEKFISIHESQVSDIIKTVQKEVLPKVTKWQTDLSPWGPKAWKDEDLIQYLRNE